MMSVYHRKLHAKSFTAAMHKCMMRQASAAHKEANGLFAHQPKVVLPPPPPPSPQVIHMREG